jgi:hypothetical protein
MRKSELLRRKLRSKRMIECNFDKKDGVIAHHKACQALAISGENLLEERRKSRGVLKDYRLHNNLQ